LLNADGELGVGVAKPTCGSPDYVKQTASGHPDIDSLTPVRHASAPVEAKHDSASRIRHRLSDWDVKSELAEAPSIRPVDPSHLPDSSWGEFAKVLKRLERDGLADHVRVYKRLWLQSTGQALKKFLEEHDLLNQPDHADKFCLVLWNDLLGGVFKTEDGM